MTDFDTWDRCITRGFPASMFPNRYNNGIRIFQSPGYVVIHARNARHARHPDRRRAGRGRARSSSWMGHSRAHWEGKTLVIETSNIKSGDSVSHDPNKRSAAPVIVTMVGGAPFNTIPMSKQDATVERLTMTGPNSAGARADLYDDPETFTAPVDRADRSGSATTTTRFYEYACHEGNHAIRGYINSDRAQRAAIARGESAMETGEADSRNRFIRAFDVDPGVAPATARP